MPRYLVDDMSCGHCVSTITKAVEKIDPSAKLDIDLSSKTVAVDSAVDDEKIQQVLRSVGYEPQPLR